MSKPKKRGTITQRGKRRDSRPAIQRAKKRLRQGKPLSSNGGEAIWQFRTKLGRDQLFETPQILWEAACEYFNWCDRNPLQSGKTTKTKRSFKIESDPRLRVYTMSGLCLYFGIGIEYFSHFVTEQKKQIAEEANKEAKIKLKENLSSFTQVIDRIKLTIYTQKFSGAAGGLLKENIISRELGLADKQNVKHEGEITQHITGMEIK